MHKGLVRRYEGPFPIIAKVGKVSYRLELPSSLKIHPVFHIEEVLGRQLKRRRGVPPSIQYLIKWKGLPESEATWETKEDLWQFQDHLHLFEATRTSLD
ncbi:hypothetical protein ABFX02_08G008550 [Erythranthe guttata]